MLMSYRWARFKKSAQYVCLYIDLNIQIKRKDINKLDKWRVFRRIKCIVMYMYVSWPKYTFFQNSTHTCIHEYEIKSGKQRWDGSTWDLQTSVGDEWQEGFTCISSPSVIWTVFLIEKALAGGDLEGVRIFFFKKKKKQIQKI